MNIRSCKAKGRRAALEVKELLLRWADGIFKDGDVLVTPSSVPGKDLTLSPAALSRFPFAIEVKNQEKLNIWSAIEQAESHVDGSEIPVVFFKRNHSEMYVVLKADQFLERFG